MLIISLANQKGGVGKTTTTANLAACLARAGRRVLAIDMDAQGHLTQIFGLNPDELEESIYHVLTKTPNFDIRQVIMKIAPGLDLAPSNVDMASLDYDLAGQPAYDIRLRRALRQVETAYDYVLIDCPPNLGTASINAFSASSVMLVCVQTRVFSLRAVKKLLETVERITELHDIDIIPYAVPTLFRKRVNVHQAVLDKIREYFEPRYFPPIHENTKIEEAVLANKTVIEYDATSSGAFDYTKLAREVINEFEKETSEQLIGSRSRK
jgi:chromosome partitioning protein